MKILKETFRFEPTVLSCAVSKDCTSILVQANVFDSTGGVLVINRIDPNYMITPSNREFITYKEIVPYQDSVSSNYLLVGVRRGMFGSSAQAHSAGAIIEAVPVMEERVIKSRIQQTLETYLTKLL